MESAEAEVMKETEENFQKNINNIQREEHIVSAAKVLPKSENVICKLKEITIQTKREYDHC